ncbi:DNA-binding GntR family transcriptional regulator [Neobacillus niacini]|uniref:GntR family transcriptional regulator n=1 Tax=Neobacillus niacini TaxID=86668 RepID=UPI00285D1367|nr:GntR family transcriptional regulator [Neobacillus niacini]MDR7077271.1 DNA-binding GntR family transcriptional regulator [Neobacillus niacini]
MTQGYLDLSKVESVERQPLNVRIYENLKSAIIKGDLHAGNRLTETEVAKQMNVSPTPVREAFRRLAAEGLVKIVPWKGVVIQSFSEAEIIESYQCREALEVLAIRLAVENIDEKGIEKLRVLLNQSFEAESSTEFVSLNSEIHSVFIEYARNAKLKTLLDLVNDVIFHDRNISAYNSSRREKIIAEHMEIFNALKEKNADKAESAMRLHIKNGLEYITQENLSKKKVSSSP